MTTQLLEKPTVNQNASHKDSQNVMIVEDESIISLDIKNSLLNLGYGISGVAASGESALTKIANNHPDLILMDIQLKGEMNGIETAEQVQSDFQIPVIYLTANADHATFQQAKSTNPYSYLLKPFGEKELGIAIEIALHKHQQEQIVRASEKWYATAFQSLNEAVVATDTSGRIIFMNAFAEEMTGWQLSHVIDHPLTDVLSFQPPAQPWSTAEVFDDVTSTLNAVLSGCSVQPFPDKTRLVNKSSQKIVIEGDAAALRETSGRIIGSIFKFKHYQDKSLAKKKVIHALSSQAMATPIQGMIAGTATTEITRVNDLEAYDAKDIDLVKSFVQSFINIESAFLSTRNLVASSGEGVTTLSARSEGLVVKVTSPEDTLTAAVKQDSAYWKLVRHVLIENHFFPVSLRTNGFCRYQHLDVPEDCQIYHTNGSAFCEAWYGSPNYAISTSNSSRPLRDNLVVLRRDAWHHIQKLVIKSEGLHIKTIAGELFVPTDDSLVWGVMD